MIESYNDYVKEKIWLDKSMKCIQVSDMGTEYILACLRMCEARKWRIRFIPIFLEELEARGFKETNPEYFI